MKNLLCLGLFANKYLLRGIIAHFWILAMAFWIPYHIWTPRHHHHPFHLADDFKRFISHLSHHVLLSTLKGEGRKWLIALIKRDISHFRSCIKEVIIPSPLSPQFPHFPAFHSFSLSPFPLPLKNYNMIILKPRGPAGGRYLVGGPSELGPLCVSRPSGAQAV